MRPTLPLLFVSFYALLSCGTSSGTDRTELIAVMDYVELDYQDHCYSRAQATWEELMGSSKGLALKVERDKNFVSYARKLKKDVYVAFSSLSLSADEVVLRRRLKLLLQSGDTLLDTEQWIRLVTFGETALNRLRFATDYDCEYNITCTLRELQNDIARQRAEEVLRRMKLSWEHNLPDFKDYIGNILPLVINASIKNQYDVVEEYWDSLVEYKGATMTARGIWQHVQPLYLKLHKYVTLILRGADEVGKPLPVHLFRSLTGDDWSNLIESLLPRYSDMYQKIYANIHQKDIGGLNAYREANNLLRQLNLGEVPNDILTESAFNGTCPPTIVNWCQPNKMRFITCKDVSIQNYMDAHETATKIRFKITTALHSNNTYILREAPRYSAIYEAVPGFVSLLSLDPHTLDRVGLYPLEKFTINSNRHRLVLQFIIALRDLPKLNYYMAVDEWRLKILMGPIPEIKSEDSWSEFRKKFSLIEPSNSDILGDPYVLFNKPYTGKFLGLILKYQIYQSFAEELVSEDLDLIKHVFQNNQRLIDVMMQGFGVPWPKMISDLLGKRENGLEYNALTDYFRLLDEYLDNQLDPDSDHPVEDYNEPPPDVDLQENEIPEESSLPKPADENKITDVPPMKTYDDILDNIIKTDEDSNSKYETTTVVILEMKKSVADGDQNDAQNPKVASYNVYWWIGVAVAIAVVVILVAIIARKRYIHRKRLQKQRRQNA